MHAPTMTLGAVTRREFADTTVGERLSVSLQWLVSGAIFAAVALVGNTMFDGVVLAIAVQLDGEGQCAQYLSDGPIIATLVTTVVTSVIVGRWLFGTRKWVGAKDDDHDPAWTAYLRARFLAGSMSAFVLFSPVKWIVMLSYTSCLSHVGWV